jgi:phosphatidylinositol alpha-1,6-mannosyltransferase
MGRRSGATDDPARARILLVTELFPPAVGGTPELFLNVYKRLAEFGVTVLTEGTGEDVLAGGMRVLRRPIAARHWGMMSASGASQYFRTARHVRRLARREHTVIHCARALPEALAARLSVIGGSTKYICWAHGEEVAYARTSRELQALTRVAYRGAAAVCANSANTAAMVRSFGVRDDLVRVVYPGVDSERFAAKAPGAEAIRRRFVSGDELMLLTVGRLQRRKGHDLVIDALATIRDPHRSFRYVIIGDGEERTRLEELVRGHSLESRVTFVGKVGPDALPAYYAAADIFVHPNRTEAGDFEGFGIVFLEAAAAGLPVIAGDSGGAPEAVADGQTGMLVSGTDVEELRRAILALADDRELRMSFGRAGRERAAQAFSWDRAAAMVAAIHAEVAAA